MLIYALNFASLLPKFKIALPNLDSVSPISRLDAHSPLQQHQQQLNFVKVKPELKRVNTSLGLALIIHLFYNNIDKGWIRIY